MTYYRVTLDDGVMTYLRGNTKAEIRSILRRDYPQFVVVGIKYMGIVQ
jgi:hypothetical protein